MPFVPDASSGVLTAPNCGLSAKLTSDIKQIELILQAYGM
jgi:hypothetical protein